MPKINKEIESQIQLAMESLSEQSKPNIRKTTREFAVPKGRLRRRWKGGKSFFQRQPNGTFTLFKITPPLKNKEDLDNWLDKVEKILESHNLHNLIKKDVL
ncbi:transcriptional regulator family: Centromere protein B DNA-binding region [Penicillium freii]|nr:transcriptional regulator family: Centromere protein B DNA-binding region [Penicillium freii]